MKNSTVKHG